jgi:hypothetical protein
VTPEDLKLLAAGPLGQEMAKFALRFCAPVFFGPRPSRKVPIAVSNGTASLLKIRGELLAVTCSHVIDGYRRELAQNKSCLFAIANCHVDNPLSQLVAEDQIIDVAVFLLTTEQAAKITKSNIGIGEAFYEITPEPPKPVVVDDYVAFGGFPGSLRKHTSYDELSFGTYSSGACRVTDCYADYLTCEFEREFWINHFADLEPESLGGLSGGPVFVIRHSMSGLVSYEYAGLIYRMHESTESLFVRQASALPIGWQIPNNYYPIAN